MSIPPIKNPFDCYIPFKSESQSKINIAKLEECTLADSIEYSSEELNILLQAQDAWIKEYREKMFSNVIKNELNLPTSKK